MVQSIECSNEHMEIRNTAVTGGKRRIRGNSLDDDASVPYFHVPVSADGQSVPVPLLSFNKTGCPIKALSWRIECTVRYQVYGSAHVVRV